MHTLDAAQVECHVFTFKEGALSALAHDLELKVTRLTLEISAVSSQGAEPTDVPRGQLKLSARFAADSLVVLHALKDGRPTTQLSPADRRKIEHTLATEVLDAQRYPEIRYEAVATDAPGAADAFILAGELTVQGHRRPLPLQAHRDGDRIRAEAALHQPDFGIRPYSALLGALKIRPAVKVRISLPWPLPARVL